MLYDFTSRGQNNTGCEWIHRGTMALSMTGKVCFHLTPANGTVFFWLHQMLHHTRSDLRFVAVEFIVAKLSQEVYAEPAC